jgi:Ca-activated chloride channel family protein
MSLSSAQRVIFAIDNFLPLPAKHIRPHELLNYFSFSTLKVDPKNDFSVLADIAEDPREQGIYTLALSVRGRPVDKQSRRNGAITLVIDRSGSMHSEGRMSYLKLGLKRMLSELKTGDIINIVLFDHQLCTPVENFVVGRDNRHELERIINALEPRGSTDLHLGLTEGYKIADTTYQGNYSNRVILITDALTNTGVVDQEMISTISKYYDARRIRLSGVGVGRDFNDALLDRLTEKGKGAYVFLGSEAEVDAVFGPRFISLIETTALDVHFKLHLPPSLRMNVFYGEESSTVKEDVQEIHYFANTSQLFLSDLMAREGGLRSQDWVMMSIEYENPETGKKQKEDYAFHLGNIAGVSNNVAKARLIMTFIDMLAQMAARPISHGTYRNTAGSWQDPDGWTLCQDGGEELNHLAKDIAGDGEVQRVLELWQKYCARYERPRHPVKRQIIPGDDSWPGATPQEHR